MNISIFQGLESSTSQMILYTLAVHENGQMTYGISRVNKEHQILPCTNLNPTCHCSISGMTPLKGIWNIEEGEPRDFCIWAHRSILHINKCRLLYLYSLDCIERRQTQIIHVNNAIISVMNMRETNLMLIPWTVCTPTCSNFTPNVSLPLK